MRVSTSVILITVIAAGVVVASVAPIFAGPQAASAPDGTAVIEATAAAYREAPALTDTVRIRVEQPGGSEEDQLQMSIGASGDAELRMQGFVFASVGPKVFIYQESLPTKYVEVPLEENLIRTIDSITNGQAAFPAPALLMRYGQSMDDYRQAFGLGLVGNLSLTGHETVKADGRSLDELQFSADGGVQVTARIDQKTHFVSSIKLKRAPFTYTFTMDTQAHRTLPEAVRFDPGGRRQVEDLSKLSLGEGDPAPDFTLEALDGSTVRLADLSGQVVVLDFWASWCGPCKRGLPLLQEFAQWAAEEGHAIKVLPVNMAERKPTAAERRETAAAFWKGQGFEMTTLLDLENDVARQYQVGPIPHTVVIGPDGIILKVKIGFDPKMEEVLQETATKALESVG